MPNIHKASGERDRERVKWDKACNFYLRQRVDRWAAGEGGAAGAVAAAAERRKVIDPNESGSQDRSLAPRNRIL